MTKLKLINNPLDLSRLRIEAKPFQPQAKPRRKSKKWRRHYVQVPWLWVERLQLTRRVSTYKLAHLLLYEVWKNDGEPLVLSNILAAEVGLSPQTKWLGLAELEKFGLVRIEHHKGRAPRLILKQLSTSVVGTINERW
jgi:hypothetical protein